MSRKRKPLKPKRRFYNRPQDQAWYAAHTDLYSGRITFPPDCSHLMQASNEYFTAEAVWNRKNGLWRCTEAAPILRWMRGMEPAQAKLELAKRGCSWIWLDVKPAEIAGELDPDKATVGHEAGKKSGVSSFLD